MKRVLKWTGVAVAVLLLIVGIGATWVQLTWSVDHPDTPLPEITASTDPEVIARGEYLVHAVAHCSTCHGPPEAIMEHRVEFDRPLAGGFVFEMGPFGTFTAANLTPDPTGIGGMTDPEVARAVRHGIGQAGKLSPMMRFAVGPMSDEDLTAIISWLRAQEPVAAQHASPRFGFLAKALSGKFNPRMDVAPPYVPPGEISIERGRYLANGPAMCAGCHTPLDPMAGFAPTGPAFSGGEPEPDAAMAGYEVVAPNLTPDPTTGHLASWSEDQFVSRLRAGRSVVGSYMPWEAFARMTDEDVRSMYRYLQTLDPVERDVGPTHRPAGSFKR